MSQDDEKPVWVSVDPTWKTPAGKIIAVVSIVILALITWAMYPTLRSFLDIFAP